MWPRPVHRGPSSRPNTSERACPRALNFPPARSNSHVHATHRCSSNSPPVTLRRLCLAGLLMPGTHSSVGSRPIAVPLVVVVVVVVTAMVVVVVVVVTLGTKLYRTPCTVTLCSSSRTRPVFRARDTTATQTNRRSR